MTSQFCRYGYSYEAAAMRATHEAARRALLLDAAKIHRENARLRLALILSYGGDQSYEREMVARSFAAARSCIEAIRQGIRL